MSVFSFPKPFLVLGASIALLLVLFSCQENNAENAEKEFQEKEVVALSEKLEFPTIEHVVLLASAKEQISEWPDFLTAEMEVDNLNGLSLGAVVENAENLGKAMRNLENSVPENLQTKPVLARIAVLTSLTGMLEQLAETPVANMDRIKDLAQKIPSAFENLKIQVNEAFRTGLEEFRVEAQNKLKPVLAPVLETRSIIEKSE